MQNTVVINVVGLSKELLCHAPHIQKFADDGELHLLKSVTPAVTCSAQSTFLTGVPPSEHGIVANGWYFKDLCEIWFWRQSNKLVQAEKVWETAKKKNPNFTCANLFWWYNMYSNVDFSVTPRPMYTADGQKLPDIYTQPASLRDQLNQDLGQFPLFNFWGPTANIISSQWIAKSAIKIHRKKKTTLTLVYLPHLDYNLQRLGPNHPQIKNDVAAIDKVCQELIEYFQQQQSNIIILSEYGIHEVNSSVSLNKLFREQGWLSVREEKGLELLDPGASQAFAVVDHQIAHVYVNNRELIPEIKTFLETIPEVDVVLDEQNKKLFSLDHPRSGELVVLAKENAWFNYYYWLDDAKAPDFARTVDIHRKPGYDPVELFLNPKIKLAKLKIIYKLLCKKMGFRTLMDVIPLTPELVKGSHGRSISGKNDPVFITNNKGVIGNEEVEATQVKSIILTHIFGCD